MRVVVVAGGSRGDVEPIIALALGARLAGHDVVVAAAADFEESIAAQGLRFWNLGYRLEDQTRAGPGLEWLTRSSGNPLRELRLLSRMCRRWAEPVAESLLTLSGEADLFISGLLTVDAIESLAVHDSAQHCCALLAPLHPSRDGRVLLQRPVAARPSVFNRWSASAVGWSVASAFSAVGQALRSRLGIPDAGRKGWARTVRQVRSVVGASRLLVPQPPDWPSSVSVTGCWPSETSESWSPPAELEAFLEGGGPLVRIGFGSMPSAEPERTSALIEAAVRRAGVRAVVQRGAAGLDVQSDDVLTVEDVPHEWLFAKVAAVVHHGGAGTTHAALRAGIPSLGVPHIGDQPYWGRRVAELGFGVDPLPMHRLSVDLLAARLRALLDDPALTRAAARAGEQVRQERGVRDALRWMDLA